MNLQSNKTFYKLLFVWIIPLSLVVATLFLIIMANAGRQYLQWGLPASERPFPVDFVTQDIISPEVRLVSTKSVSKDYQNIYQILEENGSRHMKSRTDFTESPLFMDAPAPAAVPIAPPPAFSGNQAQEDTGASSMESSGAEGAGAPGDPIYSDTNNQVAGVQEADVIKTDGRYLYTINNKHLSIMDVNGGHPLLLSQIGQPIDGMQVYFEMFIVEDRLIAVRQGYNGKPVEDLTQGANRQGISYPGSGIMTDTSVDIFDISDRTAPVCISSLSQSGAYTDARMVGSFLYLVSDYQELDWDSIEPDMPETYVPLYKEGANQCAALPEEITIAPAPERTAYTLVSGIDVVGGSFVSKESVFGNSCRVYANDESMYLASEFFDGKEIYKNGYNLTSSYTSTEITRLALNEGRVSINASAQVPGIVKNQFFMDEYQGVFRIVAMVNGYFEAFTPLPEGTVFDMDSRPQPENYVDYRQYTALYTLDSDLNLMGKITDIAPGEQLHSCRFMEDAAYFVTFRQTDPLFSVDISDPANPRILDELKIPGFSEYLHPYSEGHLFGLGFNADENTGIVRGIKLSMFDNSDPHNVTERDTLVMGAHNYSAAMENHKAILVDDRKSLIAFPADGSYFIYHYGNGTGFSLKAQIDLQETASSSVLLNDLRGLFIDDVFYVVGPNTVHSYDMTNGFSRIDSVGIDSDAGFAVAESYMWVAYQYAKSLQDQESPSSEPSPEISGIDDSIHDVIE